MATNEIIKPGNADDRSLPAATRDKITRGLFIRVECGISFEKLS